MCMGKRVSACFTTAGRDLTPGRAEAECAQQEALDPKGTACVVWSARCFDPRCKELLFEGKSRAAATQVGREEPIDHYLHLLHVQRLWIKDSLLQHNAQRSPCLHRSRFVVRWSSSATKSNTAESTIRSAPPRRGIGSKASAHRTSGAGRRGTELPPRPSQRTKV